MSQATEARTTPVEVNQAMLKIERILCPTDFSDFSAKAFDYAVSLARHYGSRVFLQHVIQPVTYAGLAATAHQDGTYVTGMVDGNSLQIAPLP